MAASHADSSTGPDQPHSDNLGAAIGDTAITAKIKAKFLDDHRLKGTDMRKPLRAASRESRAWIPRA
jgi:osmotically-inducible protein OsmY